MKYIQRAGEGKRDIVVVCTPRTDKILNGNDPFKSHIASHSSVRERKREGERENENRIFGRDGGVPPSSLPSLCISLPLRSLCLPLYLLCDALSIPPSIFLSSASFLPAGTATVLSTSTPVPPPTLQLCERANGNPTRPTYTLHT